MTGMSAQPSLVDVEGNARSATAPYIKALPPRATDGSFASGPVAFRLTGLGSTSQQMISYISELDNKRVEAAERLADDMLAWMKLNAPWKDRTGRARASLVTQVVDNAARGTTNVYAAFGVFYGVFLENKTYGGRSYAIIRPAIQYFASRKADYLK